MSTAEFPNIARTDDVFLVDALLTDEEREWQQKARTFAQTKIAPTAEADFDAKYFRSELIPEIAKLGFLGMHIKGYGCAGASPVAYGLVCLELEAVDSGWRTLVSV
ncbi:MAG: acyl-CoA dehydrogenase, partial [Actinobacteria bacterium]|nr:acyl-CoA dehydrogenase [Actinomycetota bacterium]